MSAMALRHAIGIAVLSVVLPGSARRPTPTPEDRQVTAPATTAAALPDLDGRSLFQRKGCAHCHGASAQGTDKAPSLRNAGRTWSRSKMEYQVRQGGGAMPAFGEVLSDAEVQSLLDFLVSQKSRTKAGSRWVAR